MPDPFPTPTIGLTSLSIRDFRGIKSLDLDFRGPDDRPNSLIVLAGPNGCGKTAVLEAALIAAGGSKRAVGPRGPKAIRRGCKDYKISGTFDNAGQSFAVIDTARRQPPPQDDSLPLWYFSSWRAPRLTGSLDVTVGKRGRRPIKNDSNRLKNIKQSLINAAAIERFSSQQDLLKGYSLWIEEINTVWHDFYPESAQAFQVDIIEPGEEETGSFDVFLVDSQGARLEVDYLSSGQLELFLFIGALVLNDRREGIVFIDEPELHLDPQWHRPLLRTLLRLQPKAQFLVATHSPEIYDAAQYFERHFLVPDDDPRARIWGSAAHGCEA